MSMNRLQELVQPTGQEQLLSVKYPRPRIRVPAWQAGIVVLVAVAGFLVWRASPAPAPTPTAAISEAPMVIAVVGEVEHPGLVTLAPGARVAQALETAKPLPGANLLSLNLAQKLADGQQLVVSGAKEPVSSQLSLNSATKEQLLGLSGVGEVTAAAIIKHRESIGGFSSLEQLQDVDGIGPAKAAAIAKQVSL